MADESNAPVTDAAPEPEVTPVEQEPETLEAVKAKLAAAEQKAKNKEEEAARVHNKLLKFEAEEKKRQDA